MPERNIIVSCSQFLSNLKFDEKKITKCLNGESISFFFFVASMFDLF